ncbi:MAG TPA: hypothetical protein VHZ54_08100, partial [Solirubrobacterales bacterium]|nr:hypothetical protein [Solirubrobacterales bacterium]
MRRTITTLTGYLGKDRELRSTKERTFMTTVYNEVAEMEESYEVTTQPREYLIFSLAAHDRSKTVWHRLILWAPWERGFRNALMGRKGDRVTVTGYFETFEFQGPDGETRSIR